MIDTVDAIIAIHKYRLKTLQQLKTNQQIHI